MLATLVAPLREMGVARFSVPLAGWALAVSLFLTTFVFFVMLYAVDGNWDAWKPADCLINNNKRCFCERPIENQLVKQPANTFSNLAFTVTGCVCLLEALVQQQRQDRGLIDIRNASNARLGLAFATLFGLANIILGIGSGLFHASLAFYMTFLDNLGMYLIVGIVPIHAIVSVRMHWDRSLSSPATRFVASYVSFISIVCGALLTFPAIRKKIFPSLLVLALGSELYARSVIPGRARVGDLRALAAAAISFVISYAAWLLDIWDIICDRDNHIFQLHALWHFGTALASLELFLYYRPMVLCTVAKSTSNECSLV